VGEFPNLRFSASIAVKRVRGNAVALVQTMQLQFRMI
jgi:hypothetical protein